MTQLAYKTTLQDKTYVELFIFHINYGINTPWGFGVLGFWGAAAAPPG